MFNKIIVSVVVFLIICSVVLNIYFLLGRGIIINKDYSVTNNNNNSQWQGQLMMNMFVVQGNTIEWKAKPCSEFKTIEEYLIFKNALPPQSSYFAQPAFIPSSYRDQHYDIYYTWPDIYTKTKDELKK